MRLECQRRLTVGFGEYVFEKENTCFDCSASFLSEPPSGVSGDAEHYVLLYSTCFTEREEVLFTLSVA
jgi:hypothetical protein